VTLELRFPASAAATVPELLRDLAAEPVDGQLTVGDPRVVSFLTALAKRLLAPTVARRHPELGSLGFFLRSTEIARALGTLSDPPGVLRFPRGTVFHVPPANVDTIFVYSWALSALAGNRNVVRISTRSAGAADVVLDALNATLADAHPAIRQTQKMVSYGRDDAVTTALSAACDLRVLWGGDEAVNRLRAHPLRPAARDLTFPDRASFTVLSATGWASASAAQRRAVAEGLYNDVYWFDQAACSSPRTLFWIGDAVAAAAAEASLTAELEDVLRARNPGVDAAMAVQKQVSTYGLAAEGGVEAIRFHGNALATVDLADTAAMPRGWLGTGTFVFARLDRLADLVPLIERRDQTLTHFGFTEPELVDLAQALGGRGVDRMVPVGQALAFAAVWDGYDLLREFTRLTTILT
jgi:hypothetical protein